MLHLTARAMVLLAPLVISGSAFAGDWVGAGTYKVDGNHPSSDGELTSTGANGELDFDGDNGGDSDWEWNASKEVYEQVDENDEPIGPTTEFTADPEIIGKYTWVTRSASGSLIDSGVITKN